MDNPRQGDRRRNSQRRPLSGNSLNLASDLSHQTIWPRLKDDGQIVMVVRSAMAPIHGRTSSEVVDWDLVPRPLTVNKKRKPPADEISVKPGVVESAPRRPNLIPRKALPSFLPSAIQPSRVPQPSVRSVTGLSEYIATQWPEKGRQNAKIPHNLDPHSNQSLEVADEFAEAFAQMSVVDLDIRSSIRVSHEAIRKRSAGNAQNQSSAEAMQHLLDSPPENPESPKISPPGSPEYKKNQKTAAYLAKEAFTELMRRDAEFHRLMNDLDGIEQWWFENHGAWDERKREIESKEEIIAEFREQQLEEQQQRPRKKTTRGYISSYSPKTPGVHISHDGSENDHWQEQIDLQEHDIVLLKAWFSENRMLMKEVWKKFKLLKTDAERLERQALGNDESEPKYEFDWIWTSDYTRDKLIQNRGLLWWFETARDHLVPWDSFLAERKEYWREQKDRYMALETNYRERAKTNLKTYQASEDEYDRIMQEARNTALREKCSADEENVAIQEILSARERKRQQFEEEERLLHKVIYSFVVQDNANRFRFNDFSDRYWRVNTVLKIITGTIQALEMHGYPARQPDTTIISEIMKIAYWEAQRQEHTRKLDTLLNDEDVLGNPYHTKVIIHKVKEHLRHHKFRRQVEPLIEATKSAFQPSSDAFPKLAQIWNLEYIPFMILVTNLIKQGKAKDLGEAATQKVISSWKPSKLPPVPEFPFWGWRKNPSIREAIHILNRQRTSQSYRTGYKIFKFFNSPDVFPIFRGHTSTSWTKSDFKKCIGGIIKNKIRDDALDAFLAYCNHTGELFNISALLGKIYVSEQGWERAPEVRVSDIFERKLKFQAPRGTEKLERLLVANRHIFGVDGGSRDWKKRELIEKINSFLPDGKLTLGGISKYCNYWGGVGKFFVITSETKKDRKSGNDSGEDVVLRIDNGWEISKSKPWVAPSTEPPQFTKIALKVEQKTDIRSICKRRGDKNNNIYTTEDKLYNLTYKVRTEEYHVDCSRHAFHMYLRWCDKTGEVFKFYRNGDVLVVGRLWGSMAGVEVVTDEKNEKAKRR